MLELVMLTWVTCQHAVQRRRKMMIKLRNDRQ